MKLLSFYIVENETNFALVKTQITPEKTLKLLNSSFVILIDTVQVSLFCQQFFLPGLMTEWNLLLSMEDHTKH